MPTDAPIMLLVTIALLALAGTAGAATLPATTDNQNLTKVDLMVVTAHPDDEGMCGATMARLVLDGGKSVALVAATHGEGGGNSTGKESGPALGLVREVELRRCLGRARRHQLQFLVDDSPTRRSPPRRW